MERLAKCGFGVLALAWSGLALAQQTPDVDGYLGRAVLRTLPQVDPALRVSADQTPRFVVTPTYLDSDFASTFGASGGMRIGIHSATLNYLRSNIDGSDDINTWSALYSAALWQDERVSFDATGEYTDYGSLSQTFEVRGTGAYLLAPSDVPVYLVGSLGWGSRNFDRQSRSDVNDWTATGGVLVELPHATIGVEYSANDDLNGDAVWGIQSRIMERVVVGVEDGDTVYAGLRLTFE